jgi:hypothetical protein
LRMRGLRCLILLLRLVWLFGGGGIIIRFGVLLS